jgi:hypothetical protein
MITPDSVVVRTGDLVSAPMGDELAMMDMTSGTYFVLDGIAAEVWNRIETPASVRALCAQLCEQFDVPAERCQNDVIPFLEKLQQKQMLRIVGDEP